MCSSDILHDLSKQGNREKELNWKEGGEVRETWKEIEISSHDIQIGLYVKPNITYQQTLEVEIQNTDSQLDLLDFDTSFSFDRINGIEESVVG